MHLLHEKVVVLGGSFDPPHMSHQFCCLYLLEALGARQVWLLPSFVHPFAKKLSDYEARLAMCRLLCSPFFARVVVCDIERTLQGEGRTYKVMQHLAQLYPKQSFAFALGADLMAQTHRWYRFADLQAQFPVVVIGRMGYDYADTPLVLPAFDSHTIRQRVAQKKSIRGMVPWAIEQFIAQHHLYSEVE